MLRSRIDVIDDVDNLHSSALRQYGRLVVDCDDDDECGRQEETVLSTRWGMKLGDVRGVALLAVIRKGVHCSVLGRMER